MMKKKKPIHRGEILLEEFLNPMDITQYRLAKDINVPARRINEIVHCKRAISANTALRLAKFFGMSAELSLRFFWKYQKHFRNTSGLAQPSVPLRSGSRN